MELFGKPSVSLNSNYSQEISGVNNDNWTSEDRSIMHRSLLPLPSLNRFLIGSRVRFVPASVNASNITSIELNKDIPPKQPVPDLKNTAQRYLKSLKPLLSETEYQETERIVKEFEAGIGVELNSKLLQRYEHTENWMCDWWLDSAYLGFREPVIIQSSPGAVGPSQQFSCPEEALTFAGKLIAAVVEYDLMIRSGKIKQEVAGKDPLEMLQYSMILGSHRRPDIPLDCFLHTDTSEHIIIIHNNHLFKLNVYDDSSKIKVPLSHNELAASVKDLVSRSRTTGTPIGILTGNHRDTWAKDHKKLEAIGDNGKILREIENALFVLSLDKEIPKNLQGDKNEQSFRAVQSLTGFSSDTNSGNRWFDKSLQFIVSLDGFFGLTYEHCPCEGVVIAVLHDHVLRYIENKKNEKYVEPKEFPKSDLLKFEISSEIETSISAAASAVDELTRDIDMECFTFKEFGTNEIKKKKMSPDSFIQMAIQLAYYRLHDKPAVHYESAALRRFRSSRTECIRSTCVESVEFAQTMLSNNSKEKKKEAMMKAINAHKKIALEAATGQGVDRHLFGLKNIALKEGMSLPEIFKDIGYTKSTHFTLGTSQVPFKSNSIMCYGPVTPEGYGCCYNPRPQDILVSCSSFNSSKESCTKKFSQALQQSFRDMLDVA